MKTMGFLMIEESCCRICGKKFSVSSGDFYYCHRCGQRITFDICPQCATTNVLECPECHSTDVTSGFTGCLLTGKENNTSEKPERQAIIHATRKTVTQNNYYGGSIRLADFQLNAIAELKEAMEDDKRDIVLKSPTGSGKTIILTHFMDEYCKSTSNTVFIWLTPGDGDLEEQSKTKMDMYIHNAQTKLLADVMTSGFAENDCCFINWEKLTKPGNNALKDGERKNFLEHIETALNNGLHFKIIVDESHKNDTVKADDIVKKFHTDKIIRSSATPTNYTNATLVEVDEATVIASGLIKKLIVINEGFYDNMLITDRVDFLLGKALAKQRELTTAFLQEGSKVNPLIIVQLPNNNDVILDSVERWFENNQITYENGLLAVKLSNYKDKGPKKEENFDGIENMNARPIAFIMKQAVATGWDCPRAHILVKLRDSKSETFKIQTIGRIRRMPEARHYDNDLLDCCYLYTFDTDFTERVQQSLGKGALHAAKLYLKEEYKQFTLKGEYKSTVGSNARNSTQAIDAIVAYFSNHYHTINNKYKANQSQLENTPPYYTFSNYIISRHVETSAVHGESSEYRSLKYEKNREPLNTHKHGREFHHQISQIGLKIGLEYDQINVIIRRLFGEKDQYKQRILNLSIPELYAFVLNNADQLRNDIRQAMATPFPQLAIPSTNQIIPYDFRIPQATIFTYDGYSKDQSVMTKNVYEGYLVSAEPRSDSERSFEKFCENHATVKWFYKNGDKGSEYFSIVYTDRSGKLKSFYPDYIVGLQNGETWIIETKGGFGRDGKSEDIDIFTHMKFDVLNKYVKKYSIKGGIVRKDKKSLELCICTENYSDDIHSNDWKLLKDVL